jgi:hypothetical protein
MDRTGMDTKRCVISELLALKDAPDDVFIDHVQAIGASTARSILYDEAIRLRHTDQQSAMDCITLINRINALIPPA